jgi:tricorn protease interacting factor F2/3
LDVSYYDLFIDLDFQGLKFKGALSVKLKTDRDVVLNSVGLDIERVRRDGTDFRFSVKDDNLKVETGPFDGILRIEYSGRVPDSLAGIYRAPYDGTHIVTTHFEAAQARRMFPCVDQPDVKAQFKLSVKIDNDLEAISNMPIESQTREGGKKIVRFQTTPRMSTYLLYLGVGKFEVRTTKLGGTEIIVATTPGKVHQGAFAEEEAKKAIEFFNGYYKIPYSLPKIHLVAVPEFPQGGMENWGAIAFREILLLIDENTSARIRMRTAMAIAHELAHQWFGDLVTMKWWDDIWLNESFATYMAYKAVDHAHPEWSIWKNFFNGEPNVETLAGAMSRDSLRNTHPIHVLVNSPEELEEIFDEISYGKGAHILQMIDGYVGEEAFREGVRRFLSAHAYSNATGEDLWSAIEEASGKPVKAIMSAWIQQAGFPIVTAVLHDGKLGFSQKRLLISGESEKEIWPVPLTVEANGETRGMLMENSECEIEVGNLRSLRIDPNRRGFYAISNQGLDAVIWGSEPSAYDRWGLIFDASLFLLSGTMSFNEYLSLLRRFENEDDTLPAQEISDQLTLLYTLAPSKTAEISKEFHRKLLEKFKNRSDPNSLILCVDLATRLAVIDPEYAATLAQEFKQYAKVPPDMRSAVATAYAKSTNDIDGLISAYRKSTSDEDKVRILGAMTVFADENLIGKTLDFALSGEVKRQDIVAAVVGAAQNPHVRGMMWDWLKSKIGKIQKLYTGTGLLSIIFASIIPVLCLGRVSEAETYFGEHVISEAEIGIKVGLEKLRAYDRLMKEIVRQP